MRLIQRLSATELNELVCKCWITHDAMWFAHSFFKLGIEETNRLNKAAIASLAPVEIKRFRKQLGLSDEELKSWPVFQSFFSNAAEILIPPFMNVDISYPEENVIEWRFNDSGCFAYNGIKQLGAVDVYECGPLYRMRCWLDQLGIAYEMQPDVTTCVMSVLSRCAGRFRIKPGQALHE